MRINYLFELRDCQIEAIFMNMVYSPEDDGIIIRINFGGEDRLREKERNKCKAEQNPDKDFKNLPFR